MTGLYNGSYYGNYRQSKFTDVYPDADTFVNEYKTNGIQTTISDATATTLYYLLYGKYGNSTIASSDTNQFKYKMWSIIFMYGPTWEKRLDIQEKIRNLEDADVFTGTSQIHNHSYNPSTAPSTQTLDELDTINEQNTSKVKRGKLEGYSALYTLLETDVTERFLDEFKKLFLTVVAPEKPLWYETEIVED